MVVLGRGDPVGFGEAVELVDLTEGDVVARIGQRLGDDVGIDRASGREALPTAG